MPDQHPCPFTLGELLAIWAAITRSQAAGIPSLQARIHDHIQHHHAPRHPGGLMTRPDRLQATFGKTYRYRQHEVAIRAMHKHRATSAAVAMRQISFSAREMSHTWRRVRSVVAAFRPFMLLDPWQGRVVAHMLAHDTQEQPQRTTTTDDTTTPTTRR